MKYSRAIIDPVSVVMTRMNSHTLVEAPIPISSLKMRPIYVEVLLSDVVNCEISSIDY